MTKQIALPKGIVDRDLTPPKSYRDYAFYSPSHKGGEPQIPHSFELWYTEGFGWVIPTLDISRNRRLIAKGYQRRTYAVTVEGARLVSVGHGPHVLRSVKVHVRKSRLAALRPFVSTLWDGEAKAGSYRDRLSSRRMRTSARRSGWGW
jgi:hypothetical protein